MMSSQNTEAMQRGAVMTAPAEQCWTQMGRGGKKREAARHLCLLCLSASVSLCH